MSYYFPEGSKFYFSNTFAAAKNITVLTNASPALATSTAHGFIDNDELLLTSGWEDATDTVFKADQQTVDTFTLLGLDATNTSFYPAGSGTGTAQKISSWVEIPQVLTIGTQGGDPRFTTVAPLSKRNSISVPTGFNPSSINLTLGHDPANANYTTMLGISRALSKVAFKMVLSGGAVNYGYGYMSVSEQPALNANSVNTVSAAITFLGRAMSYAS